MKKFTKTILAALVLAPAVFSWEAYDQQNWGIVEMIKPCWDKKRFEIQLKDVKYTGSWGGNSNPKSIRFIVHEDSVGTDLYKQYFAMAMASHTTGGYVWLNSGRSGGGTPGFTYTNEGNCGANTLPARWTRDMAIQYDHP